MLKRIYNKGISIIDLLLGKMHLSFEDKGFIKRIQSTIFSKKENHILVKHQYPANYNEKDKALFDHYTGYNSQDETIYQFTNVNVTSDGVIFKKLNNTWISFPHIVFRAEYGWLYIFKKYLFHKKAVASKDKIYILLFDFWAAGNYYHWLVDSMPRLLVVKELLKQDNYALLMPENYPKYIRQPLSYLEIKNITLIKKNEYLQVENVLLPYYLAGSGHIHPTMVFEVREFFRNKIDLKRTITSDKIYVSRGRQKARRVKNEEQVIEVVHQFGFEVIYFEDYTFEEQVTIGKGAKIMVSSHGANLTNSMFMPENAKVLELIRKDRPNFCYWALATVAKQNYYYQLCEVIGNDHLQVDIELFKVNLQKILND